MILNRAHVLLRDERSDLRVTEKGRIPWQIKYKKRNGVAKLHNISISGMLIETDTAFNPKDECIFSFDSDESQGLFIPQVGRLVWHKKKKFSRRKYLCGIKFLEADEKILAQMRSRVQDSVNRFVKKRKITSVTGAVVGVTIIAMIGALMWFSSDIYNNIITSNERLQGVSAEQVNLSQNYNNLYRANAIKIRDLNEQLAIANQLIAEDQAALALYSQELEATQQLLAQTETMLIQANERNAELTEQLQAYVDLGQAPMGDRPIMTITDAQSLMSTYRERIRMIKEEMRRIKAENHAERDAILAQIDDQMLVVGNNGFFVRDGYKVEVNEEFYRQLNMNQSREAASSASRRNVEIDVTFFE